MNELSKEIFENCHVRKTRAQKDKFIETVKKYYPEAKVEEGGLLKSKNIVIGDVAAADYVFGAHYDTCAVMPVPNFLMPKNIVITLLYSVLLVIPMLALGYAAAALVTMVWDNFWVAYFTELAVLFGCLGMVMFGKANKATANDNTSGVVTLCDLMTALDEKAKSKCAFVFFDHEEAGLIGSALFAKKHKGDMRDKLLINFDCVSDGDDIWFILSKTASERFKSDLEDAFKGITDKTVSVMDEKGVYYPSDQKNFRVSAGVAAFKKGKLGMYIDKIHTKRDMAFDERNIECIVHGMKKFMDK